MYSYGPPHMAVQKQDDQQEHTFSSYVRIRDVVLKTYLGRWTIRKSGERGSGISVLPARYDDDDDDDVFWGVTLYIYIYIYIYIFTSHKYTSPSWKTTALPGENGRRYWYLRERNQTKFISTLRGKSLKLVDHFAYLGDNILSTESDDNTCQVKVWNVIEKLLVIWKSDHSDKIKWDFFQAVAVSILLYRCTT